MANRHELTHLLPHRDARSLQLRLESQARAVALTWERALSTSDAVLWLWLARKHRGLCIAR